VGPFLLSVFHAERSQSIGFVHTGQCERLPGLFWSVVWSSRNRNFWPIIESALPFFVSSRVGMRDVAAAQKSMRLLSLAVINEWSRK